MSDPKRPAVNQEPFATALGTRHEREPWPYEGAIRPVVVLADYSRAPQPTRGLFALIRVQRAASGGATHTFARMRSPYGFSIHQILSQGGAANGGGLHMTNGPGAGEASNLALNIQNSSWWYGQQGTGDMFGGPPNFGFASPTNPDSLTGDTGFCGQFGAFLVPDSPATAVGLGGVVFAEWYGDHPISFLPNQEVCFISRLANVALDIHFLVSFPLQRLPTPETF